MDCKNILQYICTCGVRTQTVDIHHNPAHSLVHLHVVSAFSRIASLFPQISSMFL
jgi:hypothetical protein